MQNFIPLPVGHASFRGPNPAHSLAIKKWTREILRLDEEAIVTVTELACSDPACPVIETVIAVFDQHGSRKWKLTHAKAAVTKLNIHFALTAPPSQAKPAHSAHPVPPPATSACAGSATSGDATPVSVASHRPEN